MIGQRTYSSPCAVLDVDSPKISSRHRCPVIATAGCAICWHAKEPREVDARTSGGPRYNVTARRPAQLWYSGLRRLSGRVRHPIDDSTGPSMGADRERCRETEMYMTSFISSTRGNCRRRRHPFSPTGSNNLLKRESDGTAR